MSYVPPFSVLKKSFEFKSTKSGLVASATYESLAHVIKQFLLCIDFDEGWYLEAYPDVADAINNGEIKSARHHFVENGYFEGRMPTRMEVDEAWYLETYPDVASAVEAGTFTSADNHFRDIGYFEGRLPRAS